MFTEAFVQWVLVVVSSWEMKSIPDLLAPGNQAGLQGAVSLLQVCSGLTDEDAYQSRGTRSVQDLKAASGCPAFLCLPSVGCVWVRELCSFLKVASDYAVFVLC